MYLRKLKRQKDGKTLLYWELVESYRTERGPRQRTVAYLGEMDESGRLSYQMTAEHREHYQSDLFAALKPHWVEVNMNAVRVEQVRDFGDIWLALHLIKRLKLDDFLQQVIPIGREKIPWAQLALVLIIARFCRPKSELYIAEHYYAHTALSDLLGISDENIYDNRLYRALDKILPHKPALEIHLKKRMAELFDIQYDLLLYDVTSTYFEGQANQNSQAKRGYSRDHRPDCKQVCIALVVTKEGIPLGYELFDGNRHDVTTMQEIVTLMEQRFGSADRIWVMDRGMSSDENITFLKQEKRRFIIGTPKSLLKKFEQPLLAGDWQTVHEGLEVQTCQSPDGDSEHFILCRSKARQEKEHAMLERFAQHLKAGLEQIKSSCDKGRLKQASVVERRIGRLLQRNSRAAGLFDIQVQTTENGQLTISWTKKTEKTTWAELSQGCYLLRTNINDWSGEQLWQAYIHLTDAEAAFRIQKSDLVLRPVWHQKQDRVAAHIFICFMDLVLWKCLAQLGKKNGLGTEPRKVLHEIATIKLSDVILPTREGVDIRLSCVSQPDAHLKILLQKLGLKLPTRLTKNLKM